MVFWLIQILALIQSFKDQLLFSIIWSATLKGIKLPRASLPFKKVLTDVFLVEKWEISWWRDAIEFHLEIMWKDMFRFCPWGYSRLLLWIDLFKSIYDMIVSVWLKEWCEHADERSYHWNTLINLSSFNVKFQILKRNILMKSS